MKNKWPFPDAPNTVVFTTRSVIEGGNPILLATHDQDDGAWQFRSVKTISATEGRIAALEEIICNDPSLIELADLPPGWMAIRDSITKPWKRQPITSAAWELRRRVLNPKCPRRDQRAAIDGPTNLRGE